MPAILTNPQMDALAAAWQHAGAGFAETRAPKILDKKLISARAKQAVREMREQSEKNGNCNMTLDEISAIIAETRRERTEAEKQAASVCAQQAVREIREYCQQNAVAEMPLEELNDLIAEVRQEIQPEKKRGLARSN